MHESTNVYSIRVVGDISDPDLVRAWKRIQESSNCFPQMRYEWCEPWWRLQSGSRELHVLIVEDAESRIVAIAPLCIETRVGLRFLVSFPIHFGDFYFFLAEDSAERERIFSLLAGYLLSFRSWHAVHLLNINDESALFSFLLKEGFAKKHLSDILAADFGGMTFSEYMKTRSRNTRQKYGKLLRRLQKRGVTKLERIESSVAYMRHVEDMRSLYSARWIDDHMLGPDDQYYECRNEAVSAIFDQENMSLFLLTLDGKTIAFRLGFVHNQTFFDWKVSHDPSFSAFSPGNILVGMIIDNLISTGSERLNFMTGEYPYKRSWASDDAKSANYEMFAVGRSVRAKLYLYYRLAWRDRIRRVYYRILDVSWVRSMKRRVQSMLKRAPK